MHAPPLPLPLDGSLVVRPKRAQKLLARSPDTPPFAARVLAPPRAKSGRKDGNMTEILRRTFSFFLHTYATVLTHWLCYMIGSTIDIWNIINIGSITILILVFMKIYVLRIVNVQ
jgi:hypothetical protein